jgi:hypothetical protein
MKKFFFGVITILLIASCSNPEADGKDIAKEYCNCTQTYFQKELKDLKEFNQSFASYNFYSRQEANLKLEEIKNISYQKYKMCTNNVDVKYTESKNKYATNEMKLREFEFSMNAQKKICTPTNNSQKISLLREIDSKIKTIYPPIPSIEKIKSSLIGKKVYDNNSNKYWSFDYLGEFDKITINNSSISGDNLEMNISADLKSLKSNQKCKVKFIAKYYLKNNGWRLHKLYTLSFITIGW